jgi:excisionase family DNA binding protein
MIVTLDVEQLAALVRREVEAALANAGPQRPADPVMTTEQAAEFLQMPINVLRKRARDGVVPSFKIGALTRFRLSALNTWLADAPGAKKKAS